MKEEARKDNKEEVREVLENVRRTWKVLFPEQPVFSCSVSEEVRYYLQSSLTTILLMLSNLEVQAANAGETEARMPLSTLNRLKQYALVGIDAEWVLRKG